MHQKRLNIAWKEMLGGSLKNLKTLHWIGKLKRQWTRHTIRLNEKNWTKRVTEWRTWIGKRNTGRMKMLWEVDLKR